MDLDGGDPDNHREVRDVETVVVERTTEEAEGAVEAEGAAERAVESAVEGLVRKRRLDESSPVSSMQKP